MTATFDEVMKSQAIAFRRPESTRIIVDEFPSLRKAIERGGLEPWLGPTLDRLREGLPVPPTCRPFATATFFRLPRHDRCFHYSPSPYDARNGGGRSSNGVIAIKGLEPLAADFDQALSSLHQRPMVLPRQPPRRRIEHLALYERKAPLIYTEHEAEREATIAAEVQSRHLEVYGHCARLPLPLVVARFGGAVASQLSDKVRRLLSPPAFEAVEEALSKGFAAYLYFYPGPPIRARDFSPPLAQDHVEKRLEQISRHVDLDVLLGRWTQLFARLLYLGYLPCSIGSRETGTMLQFQNAVMDGGFVDLDSLTPIASIADDSVFMENINYSFRVLQRTVRRLIVSENLPSHSENEVADEILTRHLAMRIRAAFESERRPGVTLDPRVTEFFEPATSYKECLRQLATYYLPQTNYARSRADKAADEETSAQLAKLRDGLSQEYSSHSQRA